MIILSAKLACIVVVLSVFLIGISSAVTISITASNSGNLGLEHYYGANENANYKAEGSGEVNLGSAGISISENSKYSGEFKYGYNDEEGNGSHSSHSQLVPLCQQHFHEVPLYIAYPPHVSTGLTS